MDASDATARLGPEAAAAVDDHFQGLLEPHGIPGIAYAVGARSGVVHAGGAGIRRLGAADTPGARTPSRLCSMTKSFVAAALLMLPDEGRPSLHQTAETHLPQARAAPPPGAGPPPIP